jgi:nicotinamide-nucleotide amidase
VPRELRRMLEEQIIPRLLAKSGAPATIRLKRFHCYGLGESHVDSLLAGVEALAPEGSLKLGFRAHYPEIETKLTVRGKDADEVAARLAPVQAEVKKRLGNFILAEDDQTLEGVIVAELIRAQARLAVVETFTGGQIAMRLSVLPNAEHVFARAMVARDREQLHEAVGLAGFAPVEAFTEDYVAGVARAARAQARATHALAVLIDLDEGTDRLDFGGTIWVSVATDANIETRRARILGGREWVRLGAAELAMDCLRRFLQGLPVYERIDFEKT